MASEAQAELQSLQNLGTRILEAARLAAAVHLFESLPQSSQHYGRRVGIGGAGPVTPGDAADHSARRASRTAVVTDDHTAVHAPQAAGSSRRPPQYSEAAD